MAVGLTQGGVASEASGSGSADGPHRSQSAPLCSVCAVELYRALSRLLSALSFIATYRAVLADASTCKLLSSLLARADALSQADRFVSPHLARESDKSFMPVFVDPCAPRLNITAFAQPSPAPPPPPSRSNTAHCHHHIVNTDSHLFFCFLSFPFRILHQDERGVASASRCCRGDGTPPISCELCVLRA